MTKWKSYVWSFKVKLIVINKPHHLEQQKNDDALQALQ